MGRTIGDVGLFRLQRTSLHSAIRNPKSAIELDGSQKENVWGTYIHGIFDNDAFRRGLINTLRAKRGLAPTHEVTDFAKARDAALDKWADVLRESRYGGLFRSSSNELQRNAEEVIGQNNRHDQVECSIKEVQ
jgi:adenosylcobyric acid synthase